MTGAASNPGFILLCGCPRSGTTLLAQHFGGSLQIALPYETHFIPHFRRFLPLWGDITKPDHQRALLDAMKAYTRIWIYRGIRAQSPDRHAEISLLPVLESVQFVTGGLQQILDAVYGRYAAQVGLPYYGDKSAAFDADSLALYDRSVKNLKVVHLIRDGRDVYRSWNALWFGPRTVAEAARLWRRHVESRRTWARANRERYLEIRYEDFLKDPHATLANVARFLGISVKEGVTDVLGEVLRNEPTHPKLAEAVDPDNSGRWRDLPVRDVKLFEYIAGDTLEACGYRRSVKIHSGERFGLALHAGLSLLTPLVTRNFYLRRARALMPLIFRTMQIFGVSIDAIALRIAKFRPVR